MTISFKSFINSLEEELHSELQDIINNPKITNKGVAVAKRIKHLQKINSPTGVVEGSMPKGSARMYLRETEPHHIMLDGKPAALNIGTKIAIRGPLEKWHNPAQHGGFSLGQLQNNAEGGDGLINNHHRILTHVGGNEYKTNEHGIFPPLIDHDDEHHQWTRVGHVRDMQKSEFQKLTKTPEFPKGISHRDFIDTLSRKYFQGQGRYQPVNENDERVMDKLEEHPLVSKFLDHQTNYGSSPMDYGPIKNMGVFDHPNGTQHIIARDHGFSTTVQQAYDTAKRRNLQRFGVY